jgi:hypothetical protein
MKSYRKEPWFDNIQPPPEADLEKISPKWQQHFGIVEVLLF